MCEKLNSIVVSLNSKYNQRREGSKTGAKSLRTIRSIAFLRSLKESIIVFVKPKQHLRMKETSKKVVLSAIKRKQEKRKGGTEEKYMKWLYYAL